MSEYLVKNNLCKKNENKKETLHFTFSNKFQKCSKLTN